MIREYYALTKPGIIYGNLITAAGGFFLAAHGSVDPALLFSTISGLGTIIASSCVLNNYYDRDIDKHMERTKRRALVVGTIPLLRSLLFATTLFIVGVSVLLFGSSSSALSAALFGFMVYLFFYTPLKRKTVHSTLVGAFAGAMPPVVGYLAVHPGLDATSILLFIILLTWQMPHFYSIALNRISEYEKASIPVWPLVHGEKSTRMHILVYVLLFLCSSLSLFAIGQTGIIYAVVMSILGASWFVYGALGLNYATTAWAKKMFFFSLVILLIFSLLISLDTFLRF